MPVPYLCERQEEEKVEGRKEDKKKRKRSYLLSIDYVPGTILNAVYMLHHLIHTTPPVNWS